MVAEQEPRRQVAEALSAISASMTPRLSRPAVHVVAEEDQQRPRMRPRREVGADAAEHRGQEVEPAVHVADRVDALAFGQVGHAADCTVPETDGARADARARAPRDRPGRVAAYSMIFETTPAPTVRPPSRMAKRSFSSMAIGEISVTSNFRLSPGITISVPEGSATVPVTSVVRK